MSTCLSPTRNNAFLFPVSKKPLLWVSLTRHLSSLPMDKRHFRSSVNNVHPSTNPKPRTVDATEPLSEHMIVQLPNEHLRTASYRDPADSDTYLSASIFYPKHLHKIQCLQPSLKTQWLLFRHTLRESQFKNLNKVFLGFLLSKTN